MSPTAGPKVRNPDYDLTLESDTAVWGLILDGGIRSMQEIPQTPSNIDLGGGRNRRWGTGDPTFAQIAQSSWHGGRGAEFFHDDETRSFDSWQAMTRIPGRLIPQLLWKFATGHRTVDQHIPGSVSWHQLRGSERYITTLITASENFAADLALIWIRRRGSPGTLTIEFCAASA